MHCFHRYIIISLSNMTLNIHIVQWNYSNGKTSQGHYPGSPFNNFESPLYSCYNYPASIYIHTMHVMCFYKYVCTCENLLVTSTISLFTEDKTKLCLIPLIWDCCPSMSVCQKNSRAMVSTPGVSGLFVGISTHMPSITGACAGCLCKIKPIRSQRYSLGFSFV